MSSPSPSDGPTPPTGRKLARFSKRGKLKNGTFILPGTGERVRRQITLRNPANFEAPRRQNSNDSLGGALRRTYSQAGTFRTALDGTKALAKEFWQYAQTPTAKGILKCSLAYLLGSMGTFLPPIANFLGAQDGKHMVATITVYFHPSRSAGSMVEAAMLGIAAFCYAVFISVSSMATSALFETQMDLIQLGHAIVLIVFCGGGLGFIGWFKQKYNSPLVGVACSLASLAIITVLTKENAVVAGVFSDDKIVQVMKMVLIGITATTFVSLLFWPISARAELRENMIKTTDSFGDMLTMITGAFLSGSEMELRAPAFTTASNRYKSVFTQLAKNLKEAKLEHYVLGTEKQYRLEKKVVNCMQKLAQSIGGLRSAATTQFTLLKENTGGGSTPINRLNQFQTEYTPGRSQRDRFAVLTAIEEASEEGSGAEEPTRRPTLQRFDTEDTITSPRSWTLPTAKTSGEIFSRFIMHLGPSMKSLAYTLSEILSELPFGPGPHYSIAINEHFATSLRDALSLYHIARSEALKELYRSKELHKSRSESLEADFEEVAASCGHFSFSLYDFGTEMQTFLASLEELKAHSEIHKRRSWNWLLFWKRWTKKQPVITDPEAEPLLSNSQSATVKDIPTIASDRRASKHWDVGIQERRITEGVYRRILHGLRILERDDVRFALKVGTGAALYALFAYIPATRPFYQHWRGEWGLLSYMLVCSMTIGASNTTGWSRFIGTFLGAIIAIFTWSICQGNPIALAFCGWLVSLPCFYIILAKGNGPFGRFIMLTYNLSCLYAYSISIKEVDDDDDEGGATPYIFEIAIHRVAAVLAGCIWGLIITRVIFPISARRKFEDGLSLLWLRMGLIWKRDPLSTLLEGESKDSYMNLTEELALQKYVLQLNSLRTAAASEFELRGPFPSRQYGVIMESTSRMLEAFHAMNVVMQKNMNANEGETMLLRYTADERAQLCLRISHLFQVLASSLRLEYPLTHGLPSTANARDRLLARIFKYRKDVLGEDSDQEDSSAAKDEDYELLYAYILVTGQLAEEIKKVEKEVDELFGVMDEEMLKLQ
ncbi:Fusaric acid resistance protein-like-domain-containing protein [Bisporella sp. PMI_857]|nr:Fusaric acid resistance protein-like-domain-containing protein [Bisporella sp. PMI_857]